MEKSIAFVKRMKPFPSLKDTSPSYEILTGIVSGTILKEKVLAKFVEDLFLEKFLSNNAFEFEWDEGNKNKSLKKYGVTSLESEEAFYGKFVLPLGRQIEPHTPEVRYGILGRTELGWDLFISFTLRRLKIRIISARPMNFKERKIYEKLCEE